MTSTERRWRQQANGQPQVRPAGRAALILLAIAFATRLQFFGNPILDSDEGFYLLVGERMLHGALPYVSIWDRKPVGLFLLYAAIRSLGGDGVLGYQLVGTAVAAATASLIRVLAKPFSSSFGAISAGAAYLIWLTLGSADGGQAELFYALPVCAAAVITMRGLQEPDRPNIALRGATAMLLIGVAAQIKYNVLFEGLFFGCCWLVVGWRLGYRAVLAPCIMLWMLAAVFPTALALTYYAAHGQQSAFLYANFLSVWSRISAAPLVLVQRLGAMALILAPLLACARLRYPPDDGYAATACRFTFCWLGVSIAGVLAFGTYLEHYVLPILAPASVATGPYFGSRRRAAMILALAFLAGQAKLSVTQMAHGSRAELREITRRINPEGCLFVYSGLSALYRISGTCIATRFAFPSHLSRARESRSIGVDPVKEVDRIMRLKPETVIVRSPYAGDENWRARNTLYGHLRVEYRNAFHGTLGWQSVDVYHRRDPGEVNNPPPP